MLKKNKVAPCGSDGKDSACNQKTGVRSLEKGMTTHSSILTWKIPWTEEPGGLGSIGSQTASHD